MNALDPFIFQWTTPFWHSLGTALLLLSAFFGCGKLLLRAFPREHLAAFGCGTAVFMTLFALFPSDRLLLWGITLPFALWGIWESLPAVRKKPYHALFAAIFFLLTLGSALIVPYAWDEQTYQLALPLRYLQNSSFAPCPDNPYSFYPALTSWFFANAIKLGGLAVPRIIVSFLTPVLLLGVWHLSRPLGKVAATTAVAALLVSPLLLAANRGVYVENFIALFTLSGFFAAWKMRKKSFYAPLFCGLLAGAAFAIKPTGALGSLFLFILCFLSLKNYKKALLFCGAAFLFSFFWYLRTFLYTGNFFYPYSFFPSPGSVEEFHRLSGSARYGLDGTMGLWLNWLFAGFDRKLFDGIVTGVQMPFFGVCALTGLYAAIKAHPGWKFFLFRAALAQLLPLLLWSLFFPQSRFLLFLLPFAAAGGVWAITRSVWKKYLFVLTAIILVSVIFFQSRPFMYHYFVSWKILNAVQHSPGRALPFLSKDPGLFQSFSYLNSNISPDSRCLLLMERRGLYCPRKYALAIPGFEPTLTPVPETSEKLLEKLLLFDYIIVGETTQNVDLQSANIEACQKIFLHLETLIKEGKLKKLPVPGYPILQVIK